LSAKDGIIKISDDLELIKITENSYIHVSYKDLPGYKHFPANGLIYTNDKKAYIIDTPWDDQLTETLVTWLKDSLKLSIEGVIPTHWHVDCMGGLKYINESGIKSYAVDLTCEIAREKNLPVPQFSFRDSLTLNSGEKEIVLKYLGAGHTKDNFVVWFPEEKILFGGDILRSLKWQSLGYVGDADVEAWPTSVQKILSNFPDAKIAIPGHGQYGDLSLVRHTLNLLEKNKPVVPQDSE
jgi:metallo-beta-lactamase class B